MPKRSNEFQKLVYMLKQHAATAGATVTESKMLLDKSTGSMQEVDIVIEFVSADIPITISIECTDIKKRKATKEWVQEMKGKHDDLPTNKLVLASRSGFTAQALKKAQDHRIDTIALDVLDEKSAERIFKLWSATPTKVVIGAAASGNLEAQIIKVEPDFLIFDKEGQSLFPTAMFINMLLNSTNANHQFGTRGDDSHKYFTLRFEPVTNIDGSQIYLLKRDENPPLLRLIETIEIAGKIQFITAQLAMCHAKLGDTRFEWGTVLLQDRKALVVASNQRYSIHVS
jgi:hypothetical protein